MTDLDLTKAIEAGARALHDHDPRSYSETFETCRAREWELRDAEVALDAMLPHIRAMIAQEILEAHYDRSPNYGYSKRDISMAQEAVKDAARIAKGPQQ